MNRKRVISFILIALAAMVIWNYPLTYHVGIDGVVIEQKIPLYAKACGYLYRDWMYRDIVRGIVGVEKDPVKNALAIMKWVNNNIIRGVPEGIKTVDDHPLNIIIRSYGSDDQLQDIFTILCSYAGMKAGMAKCFNSDKTSFMVFSLVRSGGRWLIFDAIENKRFLNKEGGIASVEDYARGDLVISGGDKERYGEFLDYLKHIDTSSFTRAEEQMPLKRIPAGIKKMLNKDRQKP